MIRVKEFIRKTTKETIDSIKIFSVHPFNSLGQLIPVGMLCTSFIGFIVAIIMFAVEGGFSNQIIELKEDFFGGISEGVTGGNVSAVMYGIVSTIILIFLLTEIVIIIVSFYMTEGMAKKIIASICFGIAFISGGITLILAVGFGEINLSPQMEKKVEAILLNFEDVPIATFSNILKISILALGIAVLVFLLLIFLSEHRRKVINTAIALLLSYIVLPLCLLLIENLIPLCTEIAAIVIIGGAIVFGCIAYFGGGGESSGSSKTGSGSINSATRSGSGKSPKEKNQQQKVYDLNTTFWRDKGGYGIAVPQADCIYMKNAWGEKTFVCTVSEFERGDVAIINKKVRITKVAGCNTPMR